MEKTKLAKKHIEAFRASKGDPAAHADYLREHFSDDEIDIGGRELLSDPAAEEIMLEGFKKIHGRWRYKDKKVREKIISQINLIRSYVRAGLKGDFDD